MPNTIRYPALAFLTLLAIPAWAATGLGSLGALRGALVGIVVMLGLIPLVLTLVFSFHPRFARRFSKLHLLWLVPAIAYLAVAAFLFLAFSEVELRIWLGAALLLNGAALIAYFRRLAGFDPDLNSYQTAAAARTPGIVVVIGGYLVVYSLYTILKNLFLVAAVANPLTIVAALIVPLVIVVAAIALLWLKEWARQLLVAVLVLQVCWSIGWLFVNSEVVAAADPGFWASFAWTLLTSLVICAILLHKKTRASFVQ